MSGAVLQTRLKYCPNYQSRNVKATYSHSSNFRPPAVLTPLLIILPSGPPSPSLILPLPAPCSFRNLVLLAMSRSQSAYLYSQAEALGVSFKCTTTSCTSSSKFSIIIRQTALVINPRSARLFADNGRFEILTNRHIPALQGTR